MSLPWKALYSSGKPAGLLGSTSMDQSMRFCASHCLSLPFWYRDSNLSRPSSYSHVNRVSPAIGRSHVSRLTSDEYLSYVLIRSSGHSRREALQQCWRRG